MLSRLRPQVPRGGDLWHVAGILLLVGLVAAALVANPVRNGATGQVPVEVVAAEGAGPGALRIRFELPPAAPGEPPWVVWMPRLVKDAVWLEAYGWNSPRRGFYSPDPAEGVLPGGYSFPLPRRWEGPVEATLHALPAPAAAMRPLVLPAGEAVRLEQAAAVGSAAVYASLLMLSMLALSLYAAARDRVFLTLFACTGTLVLMLAGLNGHLYALPGLRILARLGGAGVSALVLIFLATWVRLIQQYVGMGWTGGSLARACDIAFWALLVTAGLCLAGLGVPGRLWQYVVFACWGLAGAGSLVLLLGAARRGVAMAWVLVALLLLVLGAALMLEFLFGIEHLGPVATRLAYQGGLVLFLTICSVGLVHRISEYREQRDRDRLARADTERRMLREAARTDLVNALQSKLRQVEQREVAWTGFRVMADHLLPLLPVHTLVVVADGYHERDLLLVDPALHQDRVAADLRSRTLALRRQTGNGIALQQPFTSPAGVHTEAVIPLKVRTPSWAALILRRSGTEGFAPDEMALASEFSRIAQIHIDQAVAAIKLRQSAELDALTGSLNRRSIDQWLVRSFAEAERGAQPLSVLFVDLDRFKGINDRFGHAAGDHCLRVVAGTLAGALEEGDVFGRYGGEEFIAILPGRGGALARQIGERLRAAVERQAAEWEGQVIKLTVSVGVATRREGERTPAATIERADKALYAAKRAGRNCVHVAPAVFT